MNTRFTKHVSKYALIAMVVISLVFVSEFVFYANEVSGGKPGKQEKKYGHGACSNKREVCISGCDKDIIDRPERKPKQTPPVPTPTTTPAPPFGQTTTTTQSEIRCSTTNDCNINFVCCQNACHEESKGICRDINGDGIPDWLVYAQ